MNNYFSRRTVPVVFTLLALSLCGRSNTHGGAQAKMPTPLHDNSDWWSSLRTLDSDEGIPNEGIGPEAREFRPAVFTVLGILLGEKLFTRAAAVLGPVEQVQRGDAATGRIQACYVSPGNGEKIYLIFEQGELDFSFYLFAAGPPWYGSDRCAHSARIRRGVTTGAGLRLGQTPAEIIAILGRPTKRLANELIYSFLVEKPLSPKDLARAFAESRGTVPQLSKEQFKKEYGNYDLCEYVDARFAAGRLFYLAVSRLESY